MRNVGVVGATSPVGGRIVRLLHERGDKVIAFTRNAIPDDGAPWVWRQLPAAGANAATLNPAADVIEHWIFIAHIWVVPEHFQLLKAYGAKRMLAVSSTSAFTKVDSNVASERTLASRLRAGEQSIAEWSQKNSVGWTVLRPTLIYGGGRDRNIAAIAKFVKRFRFFPLIGGGGGLRQPVHSDDVAKACIDAVFSEATAYRAYNISGAEVLSYRQMVERVFAQLGRRAILIPIPLTLIKLLISIARIVPSYRYLSGGMAERMSKDMVFDHDAAAKDFAFSPRSFALSDGDVA